MSSSDYITEKYNDLDDEIKYFTNQEYLMSKNIKPGKMVLEHVYDTHPFTLQEVCLKNYELNFEFYKDATFIEVNINYRQKMTKMGYIKTMYPVIIVNITNLYFDEHEKRVIDYEDVLKSSKSNENPTVIILDYILRME